MSDEHGLMHIARQTEKFISVEHLSHEAVAALVDKELGPAAARRAHGHLARCAECRREVVAQARAAQLLRVSNADAQVKAPQELMERLQGIAKTQPGAAEDAVRPPAHERLDVVCDALRAVWRARIKRG
ncbi:anti-sigma factor [Corynebacterium uterequi]|nr:hypothetical protein [Corynebacterium uterequi]